MGDPKIANTPGAAGAPGDDADPTAQHELRQLEAMAGEEGAAEASAESEQQQIEQQGKAERAAYYSEKVRPFVDAWGSRLRYPLHPQEAKAMSEALGGVGAEIMPGDTGKPVNPWLGLVLVSAGIAVPRVIRSMNEKREAKTQGAAPGAPVRPGAEKKKSTDPMLDGLSDFDAQQSQPH